MVTRTYEDSLAFTGRVILLPENEDFKNPENWRPIACLLTMYKVLTAMIAEEIGKHCRMNNIIEDNQRGCKKEAEGCKDQLMMNRYIKEDASENQKNLSVAWINDQKVDY